MLSQLSNQINTIKECTAYEAPRVATINEKWITENVDSCHEELKKTILKLSKLCAEREGLYYMLSRCSLECYVANDEDDYGEEGNGRKASDAQKKKPILHN